MSDITGLSWRQQVAQGVVKVGDSVHFHTAAGRALWATITGWSLSNEGEDNGFLTAQGPAQEQYIIEWNSIEEVRSGSPTYT